MDNEFKTVKGKRRKYKADRGQNFCGSEFVVDYVNVNINTLLRKVNTACDEFSNSDYKLHLLSTIKAKADKVENILCYGLGSFSESYISCHQLAALLALKTEFNCKTVAYDPVFNPIELDILKRFGVEVLKKNDEGKHRLSPTGFTIVYFSHCSSQLVNNFLWANWNSSLYNSIILSNCFSTVIKRNDEKTVESLSCMRDIIPAVDEFLLNDSYQYPNIFNDLCVHSFPPEKIQSDNFWEPRPEPNYEGQPLEFCTKEVVITLRQI